MSRFKVGQEVVCIKKTPWVGKYHKTIPDHPMPKFNEVVHVTGRFICEFGEHCVNIAEYPLPPNKYFLAASFVPLITDSELASELESITQKVTI